MSDNRTSPPPEPKYPEAEKWAKIHSDVVIIRAFTDWLEYTYGDKEPWQRPRFDDLMYEYFEIDAKKLENERRAMIESLR